MGRRKPAVDRQWQGWRWHWLPASWRIPDHAGHHERRPGVKHDIQRALNVRNLNPATALTQEQVAYLDHAGSYEPEPRLRDMDVQGIDQVMIIPTDIDTYPWLQNALGARAFCKVYNVGLRVHPGGPGAALLRCPYSPCRIRSTPERSTAWLPRGAASPRPSHGRHGQLPHSAQV